MFGIPAGNLGKYILGTAGTISPEAGVLYDNVFDHIGKGTLKGYRGNELNAVVAAALSNQVSGLSERTSKEIVRL